ncbi:uncharacterized protein LOC113855489 [Abrus precatorius]|uniref:RING-type E3 ubiquitin transferase n=1 Tax=Abrus precatorius TaxID=3816 RepID=A0A8B8KGQ0_ABRPR|nr:uncharacterized protein LOC113855489 [Abrus precatorius]
MVMDSLLSLLIFLLTLSSFNLFFSFASQPSYKDHCASIVPESTPNEVTFHSFPLGDQHTGYFTGGDSIIDVGTSLNQFSFYLRPKYMQATQVIDLFKIGGTVTFRSTSNTIYYRGGNFSYGDRVNYGHQSYYRRRHVTFKLDGFWSESSGKVCMVGNGNGYSKTGKYLNLDAVFKLDNVFNASNITSLVSGSLESLSSENEENHFEPISVLMFPKANYSYTLDSVEADKEFSSGGDALHGLALKSLSFCSYPLSRAIRRLQLEFSRECNSSKNCTPIAESSGQLPSLMSLKGIECSLTNKKHRLRVLVRFSNISNYWISQNFNPKTMLVGEGWWDEKKNMLCVVACHIMGKASSLVGTHVGDCSIRLRLRFPSIWSINSTSSIVGQIWSNKTTIDPGYFKMITFRNYEDRRVRDQATKYEYSLLDKVKRSCPAQKPVKNQSRGYPDAHSYDMRFDMSVRESNKRVAWGYSSPLSVGDQISNLDQNSISVSTSSSIAEAPMPILNGGGLFNMSYKISLMYNSTLNDRNSVFNLSSYIVRISAEGLYDSGAGTLCMVGCRDLHANHVTPIAGTVDCEVLVKFQFPSVDTKGGSYITGTIKSTRKKSDPLYFKDLELTSAAFYTEIAEKTVWRMDMEIIMVLISTTLACVFVGLQLFHVKRNPNVLPLLSLVMLSILTLGYMIPLVLNFEALLAQNPNNKNFVFGNVGWLEVNEIAVRLITMVAFLLQFRLLQLTWSSRKGDEGKKGLLVAERKATYVTVPLYVAGLLFALLLKLKKDGETVSPIAPLSQQHHLSWESLKSYGGLVLDGFLLPQIILNLFSNTRESVLSCSFYFGTTFVRLLPHAYDLYRTHNYARLDNGSYFYADPSADFYSTAWDIVIPLGGILFAIIIYLQQRFGAHYILPHRFKGSMVYEKVPESEAEVETTNL